jgi:hypothetical protein
MFCLIVYALFLDAEYSFQLVQLHLSLNSDNRTLEFK